MTIDNERAAEIRRLFYAEHWKVGTIASELGVHRDAVARAIESERFHRHATSRVPTSKLDPYKALLGDTLAQHPRLRATRLYEMVRSRGYTGSVVQLRRYVATVRPTTRHEAYLRLRTLPGEQAQVDWGHFGTITIGRAERALSCFVMVLSYSRGMYARFFLDQTTDSFLRGHVLGFEALGGVPRTILYDNLKAAVLERHGEHIRYNPALLELSGHYHFAPRPCAPYRGNEKGKVERTIQYLRHTFFAARRFASIDDLNAQMRDWITGIAHQRPCPGDAARRCVADVLDEERPRLLPLPEHRLACDTVRSIASGKTPYLRFDLNDYSIPHTLVGRPLTLIASETEVRIADGQTVVATHARSYDRGQTIEDEAHLAALGAAKRHARELRGRDRLCASCRNASALLEALTTRNEPLGPQTHRLLLLVDRYGAGAVDAAIAAALERGAVSTTSVEHILAQRRREGGQPPPVPLTLPDDPRVRDLRVVPHDLSSYDALTRPKDRNR